MRVAFAGTPDFAARILRGLIHSPHDVGLVVSQPDARRGRGRRTTPTPVASLATENNLPLLQPARIGEAARDISTFDALVVAAYGQILRSDTLHAAEHGSWNVHASLLPKYRGAAPVERAVMAGETETGVTIIEMDEGLDTGKIALKRKTSLPPDATGGDLLYKMADLGAEAIVEVLGSIEDGGLSLEDQDDTESTYAPKISGPERELDWTRGRVEVRDLVRALSPHIGARAHHVEVDGPIKVWSVRVLEETGPTLAPGEIAVESGRMLVGCGDGAVSLERLQLPGRRAVSAAEFLRGNDLGGGFRL